MRSLILVVISYIISYKFLNINLLEDHKNLKINEIPDSYNNFLYFIYKFLIKNLNVLKDYKDLNNQ